MSYQDLWIRIHQTATNEALREFQDVLEVTISLEKQRACSEEDPIKEFLPTDLLVF